MWGNSWTSGARLAALALSSLAAALAPASPPAPEDPAPPSSSPSPSPSASSSSSSSTSSSSSSSPPVGQSLYLQHCATCHMANGRGVPNFQPALVGSPIVDGPRDALEATVWAGSAFLGSQRENPFGTNMPPFGYLSGEEVKVIVDYVREAFGKDVEGRPAE